LIAAVLAAGGAILLALRSCRASGRARARRGGEQARTAHAPVTQAIVPVTPADTYLGVPGRNLDRRLDEALKETFPASDPIAICIEEPGGAS
jgi:hypothetical protein